MKNALVEVALASDAAPPRIQADDFDSIVQDHQRRIYRILFLLLHDADEADSLTQECFLRAFTRRGSFRGEAGIGTWLMRIAINLAQDHLKSRRASFWRRLLRSRDRDTRDLADRRHSPEEMMAVREQVATIWTAVERLPLRQRMAFTLRFGEDMSIHEIAGAMKLREGSVKAHLFNALNAIRRDLERFG